MKKIDVLIVDDDFINLKLLETMLKKNDMVQNIFTATNGLEALEVMKKNAPDIVLLDIIMPVMNGIEMLKFVKNDQQLSQIPVIVLSTDETKKNDALENGALGFINKPIREQQLMETIRKYTQL